MRAIQPYNLDNITYIRRVDHPESISIGPKGEAYTTGTAGQVYRLNLENNTAEQFASTAPRRVLGQAVDARGNLYCADCETGRVIRITPQGEETTYATGPGGKPFSCTNYPAFDRLGNMYLSDSGAWTGEVNGHLFKIPPGGGEARLWYTEPVITPNAIALDPEEKHLYFAETLGSSISRVRINADGSAGALERILTLPKHMPDGIAFDDQGRVWIAFHRPDAILVLEPETRKVDVFAEDWRGMQLRSPTDVSFAGPERDILLASTLGQLCVHRFDQPGARGLRLNNPEF